ncbi:MAG: hypothetical protein ACXW3K_05495 [Brevundimonas sp.]
MLLATAMLMTLAAGDGRCAAALEAAPAYTACAEGRLGVALADTEAEAARLLAEAESGEPRFKARFMQDPAPYVVLLFESDPPVAALNAAGFSTVLAWPSVALTAGLFADGFRRSELAAGGGRLSPEAEDRVAAQSARMVVDLEARRSDVVAHEMGHLWYDAVFWRGGGIPSDGYGTGAPDWLDETSAILTEGDGGLQNRRFGFSLGWAATSPEGRMAPGAIGDLKHFLERRHPSQTNDSGQTASSGTGPVTVTVTTRVGGDDYFDQQVRVFADYMLERSGNPAIFGEITRSLAAGGTFENWLATQTGSPDLPSTGAALQSDWMAWIERTAR